MIPSKKQWSKWTLPSKHTTIGLLFSIFSMLLAVTFWYFPKHNNDMGIQDAVLKSQNPTEIELTSISTKHWVGDNEPYLTLVFENYSKNTAYKFSAKLNINNIEQNFTPTKTSTYYKLKTISVGPGEKLHLPIAPLSEIEKSISTERYFNTILGFGKRANMPIEYQEKINSKYRKNSSLYTSAISYPFLLNINYETIFKTEKNEYVTLFAYLDTTIRN